MVNKKILVLILYLLLSCGLCEISASGEESGEELKKVFEYTVKKMAFKPLWDIPPFAFDEHENLLPQYQNLCENKEYIDRIEKAFHNLQKWSPVVGLDFAAKHLKYFLEKHDTPLKYTNEDVEVIRSIWYKRLY
jgi:hypothetical protein